MAAPLVALAAHPFLQPNSSAVPSHSDRGVSHGAVFDQWYTDTPYTNRSWAILHTELIFPKPRLLL